MNPIEKFCRSLTTLFKLSLTLVILALLLFASSAKAGNYVTLINGNLYTNNNVALYSGTNSAGTITNNYQLGIVPASSNVLFNLSSVAGSLPLAIALTNSYPPVLPAEVFFPNGGVNGSSGGYPNTLYGAYNNTLIGIYYSMTATNIGITSVAFIFAGSIDGVLWQTNALTMVTTVPASTIAAPQLSPTNMITYSFTSAAWPMYALQQINNSTNTVSAITNIVIEVTGKPGI